MENQMMLQIMGSNELTNEQTAFKNLHNEIMANGRIAMESLAMTGTKLKEMRDKSLYKSANYETFDQYCVDACGFKSRQAYNFIKNVETYGTQFLIDNQSVGVTKLALLAGCDAEDRQEIIESVDLNDISVAELKAKIKEQEDREKQMQFDLDSLNAEAEENAKRANKAECDLAKAQASRKEAMEKYKADYNEAIDRANKQEAEAKDEIEKYKTEIEILKALRDTAEKKPSEPVVEVREVEKIVTVKDEEAEKAYNEKIASLELKLKEKETELQSNAKQRSEIAIRIQLATSQVIENIFDISKLIESVPDEERRKKMTAKIKEMIINSADKNLGGKVNE